MRQILALYLICTVFAVPAFAEAFVTEGPAPAPIRVPAEFEPAQGVLLQWDPGECDEVHLFLIQQINEAGATAYVLVDDPNQRQRVVQWLMARQAPLDGMVFIVSPTESIWVRDYSPWNIYAGPKKHAAFVGWQFTSATPGGPDGYQVATAVALRRGLYRASRGAAAIIADGGDFMTDGFGTSFCSYRVVSDNGDDPERMRVFQSRLGIERSVFFERLESIMDKHLDMYMKLLDEETVLVGEYAKDVPDAAVVERNVAILQQTPSCYGTPYRIVRIPMPGNSAQGDVRSYTNSLIVNSHVIVPHYGIPLDDEALRIYQEAMPGYRIVGYDCSNLIRQRGAIHCITHEIAPEQTVRIGHARCRDTIQQGQEVPLEATIWSTAPVHSVLAHVCMPGEHAYTPHVMEGENGTYTLKLTMPRAGEVRYFLSAHARNVSGYKPQNAYDGGYLSLTVLPEDTDTKAPVS